MVLWVKARYAGVLRWTLEHPGIIISCSALALVVALALFPFMGREFLPPFNEGTLNINTNLPPGTSLLESNRVGDLVERALLEVPEVVTTTRRTGRAELDEHAAGVSTSEIEVVTKVQDRGHAEFMEDVRQRLSRIPGVDVEVGQPISHRIDHMLSGTRAQIAIKLFGPDLQVLRTKGAEIRKQIGENVELPQGYYIQYGGQFEAPEKAAKLISGLSLVAIGVIYLLLYVALDSGRSAALVMANLPLALIGGGVMVFLTGGTLSIASLVGFITLFGIATRNGIMLVTHYQYLMEREGKGFRQAIVQGSMERLSPILMTALVTGVGLIPLALGVGDPGKEIQQPMAVVILGGIVSSTLLNMIVIPALFLRFGEAAQPISEEDVRG